MLQYEEHLFLGPLPFHRACNRPPLCTMASSPCVTVLMSRGYVALAIAAGHIWHSEASISSGPVAFPG